MMSQFDSLTLIKNHWKGKSLADNLKYKHDFTGSHCHCVSLQLGVSAFILGGDRNWQFCHLFPDVMFWQHTIQAETSCGCVSAALKITAGWPRPNWEQHRQANDDVTILYYLSLVNIERADHTEVNEYSREDKYFVHFLGLTASYWQS